MSVKGGDSAAEPNVVRSIAVAAAGALAEFGFGSRDLELVDPAGDTLRFGAAYAANPEWLRRALSIGLGLQRRQTPEGPAWGAELRTDIRW